MTKLIQDISRYQLAVDFDYLKLKGQDFIVVKSFSGGGTNPDVMWESHYANATKAGIRVAPYLWVDPIYDAETQAKKFIDTFRGKENIAFVVLDFEHWWADWTKWQQANAGTIPNSAVPVIPQADILAHFKKVYDYVAKNSGYNVLVYTAAWYLNSYCKAGYSYLIDKYTWWADYSLFNTAKLTTSWENLEILAPVGKKIPTLPSTYPLDKVMMWQWSGDKFMATGVYGNTTRTKLSELDLNIWINPFMTIEQFSKGGAVVTPPEEEKPMQLYYPLPEGIRITQGFGENPQWYPSSKGHNGIDWGCVVGTEIYAMEDGVVTQAEAVTTGYGRHVRLQHAKGVSIYGHLSKLAVKVGDQVKAMQIIGYSGGNLSDPYRGNSTGAHLHAEYRLTGVANPVPGGYAYNAIDLLPILISHKPLTKLYDIKVIVSSLNVRSGAGTDYPVLRTAEQKIYGVYAELGGFIRINATKNEWIKNSEDFVMRVTEGTPVDPPPVVLKELYKVVVTIPNLNVRVGDGSGYRAIRFATQGFAYSIYAESNGYGRISDTKDEWIYLADPSYVRKVGQTETYYNYVVTSLIGLRIRAGASTATAKIGLLGFNKPFLVESVSADGWGKLYGRDGYVFMQYAKPA